MNIPAGELVRTVKETIYQSAVTTGRLPSVGDVAAKRGLGADAVASAFRALADAHIVVLQPGSLDLWSAPPFSGVPTSFRVRASGVAWHAPCAWDSFGIPAAIKRDVTIDARCAWSGQPLPAAVRNGRLSGDGVVHLEVPARRFWDDIFYT